MSNEIPRDIDKEKFPISPSFAENTPDDVMQWVLIVETMEVYEDKNVLDKIGIHGEARDQLLAHMTRSRLSFINIIRRGMDFKDDDGTKLPEMTEHAQHLVDEARLSNIPPETDPPT